MDSRSVAWRIWLCAAASTTLAACGGGGGGAAALPPVASSAAQAPVSGPGAAAVAFSIAIPSATAGSSHLRSPRYVSAGTKSVAVTYAGQRQTADCTTACSMTLAVSPGPVTFSVNLYDAAGGSGNVLATGSTTTTILAGQQNTVKITFAGVVAKVAIALGAASVTAGTPAAIPVTVTAQDAAGYTIVGSDPYAAPIVLTDDDASGATSLSTKSVTAPATAVTLNYDGSAALSAVHLGASAAGVTVQPVTLAVQPAAQTVQTGSAPAHETTWYYFGLNGVNASIPASWMAAHADYAEDDGFAAQHAEAFKDAGGSYAVAYTDPAYVPYCFAPFSGPQATCRGQVGNLVTDESGWFHGADGTRVRRYVDQNFGYQEALNPSSAAAQSAFAQMTQNLLTSAPKLDYFFADDTGGVFIGSDGTQMSGWFYGFDAPAVEMTTDAQFIPAQRKMFAAAAKPLIVNGVDPSTLQPSYGGAWLDSPNVSGQFYEGCYSDGSGVAGANRNSWVLTSNSILTTIAHKSKAICMMTAGATAANRIYELATWWLTYAEPYSVAAPAAPLADGLTVVPEYDIVPRSPRKTAVSAISELRTASGAYAREFASCYQAGTPIGPCAAVVNPTGAPVAMPALTGHYTTALAVDDKSAYAGGAATWSGAVPGQIPALGAVVLR